ncbi:Acyl carrier protein [Mycobacterium simulans]|uniref:acyl carrier protein n=1 Tax=Mycobacterium simulans TaxID=627089 RepID=UPI00174DD8EE|nr:acyl carrier protein [Mycobacterium simulans]SON59380.1 Acyl carrier protein [Mycobacterium simulans]
MDTQQSSITDWCRKFIGEVIGVPVERVDPTADFDRLGVDSAVAVAMLMEVQERYGVDIPLEALFETPTISAVAQYLHAQTAST